MQHYNPAYQYIPVYDRAHVYSDSIRLKQYLWVKPTYEPGEIWQWYGDTPKRVEIIKILDSGQVLVREISEVTYNLREREYNDNWTDIKDGDYHVYHVDKYGYARNGTPSLRVRIK